MSKKSLKAGAGELLIDHSDSPGLTPEDVAHIPGAIAVGRGQKFEIGILSCSHCSSQVYLNPKRTRPRGYCAKCDHYVCDNPICNKECQPVKKLLDKAQDHISKFIGKEDDPASTSFTLDEKKIILTDL